MQQFRELGTNLSWKSHEQLSKVLSEPVYSKLGKMLIPEASQFDKKGQMSPEIKQVLDQNPQVGKQTLVQNRLLGGATSVQFAIRDWIIPFTIPPNEEMDLHNNEEGKDELLHVRLLLSKQKLLSL